MNSSSARYPGGAELRYYCPTPRRKRASRPGRWPRLQKPHPRGMSALGVGILRGFIMRISARNQIKGTVIEVQKGATTSHIRVDIGGGQIVTSSITNEAVDDLGIKAGGKATVVIKASDVMIAVD
jgi:molybdopterin-binding protein